MEPKKAYEILGIREDATTDDVKKAFRNRAKETHPDIHPEKDEEFKDVGEAYSTITSLVKVNEALLTEIKNTVEIQDKRNQILQTVITNLIEKRNSEIVKTKRSATNKLYIVIIAPIPLLIAIFTILQGLLSMTQMTPYVIMGFLLTVVITMLTLINNRDIEIQDIERKYDDKIKEFTHLLRGQMHLEGIHHALKEEFKRKREPMEKEEILSVIQKSIKDPLRETLGDAFEEYITLTLKVLSIKGYLQTTINGKYNVN